MGQPIASSKGFKFTKVLQNATTPDGEKIVWDKETMFEWLANPKAFLKGTSMAFPGFKKEKDRADVVAYLGSLK